MSSNETTTLVSLFHTQEHAIRAMSDLQAAGVPTQAIQTLGGETGQSSISEKALTILRSLNLPADDLQVLSDGIKSGGTLIVVHAADTLVDKVERVFGNQDAEKIYDRTATSQPRAAAASVSGETIIPVVEEELVVGKQKVDRGGVRVFSRLVETPVEEQIVLREEHATFERHAVNRPISQSDLSSLENQSFEVHEMGEEAVVGKTARVVEEVRVGKESTEQTQLIKDTVRKTQVEVSQLEVEDHKLAKRDA